MNSIVLRPLTDAPESELSALRSEVFADHEDSAVLTEVLAAEAAVRPAAASTEWPFPFGLVAYRGESLVGWTEGYRQGRDQFHVLSSGVVQSERRNGIYSILVRGVLDHAASQGYVKVNSRHSSSNAAVLIAN